MKILTSLLLLLTGAAAFCQAPINLRVATRQVPPFVVKSGEKYTGFSVDLWKALSDKLNIHSTYLVKENVSDLLHEIKEGKADLGVAAISITSDRVSQFDFSEPVFDAGLQIMTPVTAGGSNEIAQVWQQVLASGIFRWLAAIFAIGLIPAHIVYFVEKRTPNGIIRSQGYFHGILEAYWWTLSCLATQAEEMPKSGVGRTLAVLWMFTAVVFLAFFTAQVTASLTVQQLQGNIQGPDDLPGKRVATTAGSTSATYLKANNAKVIEFAQIEQAYEALEKGEADAVVFDSPVLQYFVAHGGKGRFQVVGSLFRKEYYGIVFPPNSPYRKPIDRAILQLKENGTYSEIYDKWFSAK